MAKEDINQDDPDVGAEAFAESISNPGKKIQVTHSSDDEQQESTEPEIEDVESQIQEAAEDTTEINDEVNVENTDSASELVGDTGEEPTVAEGENAEVENSTFENDEKNVGPDGPYSPELTKTIEEALSEAEKEPETTDIDEAVDDIVRSESDEVIASEDEKLAGVTVDIEKRPLRQKIKDLAVRWWENKKARYGTLAGLFLLLVFMVLMPFTRYSILNLFGVRVSSSLTVIDSQTRLPLKNIIVSLQDMNTQTDENGAASFSGLKLGDSSLSITKIGYADNTKKITLGWGSNPLGDQEIIATGEQFTFVLSDWKSNKPIKEAEAVSGENSARSDENGKIVLTVGEENISSVEVKIEANGYRTETIESEQLSESEIVLKMVPGKKHVFVSNRNGEFDLYKIDVDSKNEEILLGSTGDEKEVPSVLAHPNRDIVAFVSSRDNEENGDGFVLDGLYVIDALTGETRKITRSEQLQMIGWYGDNLVFWQVVEGTSRGNPERSKLISYNERTGERIELAAANYFNSVKMVGNTVYYAVSSFAVPQSQAKLYSVNIDGTLKEKVIDFQVWDIFRTGHDTLLFSAANQKWYEKKGTADVIEVSKQPVPSSNKFVDSPEGDRTAWVEVRDGKGVLLLSSTGEYKEEQIISLPGLNEVLYWANDSTLIYRVISNSETADYVLNLDAVDEQKIVDVTATRNTYF